MKYIVELEKNVWIAHWEADPGRTIKIENAKKFDSKKSAQKARTEARKYRDFLNAKIVEVLS